MFLNVLRISASMRYILKTLLVLDVLLLLCIRLNQLEAQIRLIKFATGKKEMK